MYIALFSHIIRKGFALHFQPKASLVYQYIEGPSLDGFTFAFNIYKQPSPLSVVPSSNFLPLIIMQHLLEPKEERCNDDVCIGKSVPHEPLSVGLVIPHLRRRIYFLQGSPMLVAFRAFWRKLCELLVEILFPRSGIELRTAIPQDLHAAHNKKFVDRRDLVDMCGFNGTNETVGILRKDGFLWVRVVEVHGYVKRIGNQSASVGITKDWQGIDIAAIAMFVGFGPDLFHSRSDIWEFHPVDLEGKAFVAQNISAEGFILGILIKTKGTCLGLAVLGDQ